MMKMTGRMCFVRLFVGCLGTALWACRPSSAQAQEKQWVLAECPATKDAVAPVSSVMQTCNFTLKPYRQEEPVKQLVQDALQVGGAYKYAKFTREATLEDVQKNLRIFFVPKERAEKLAPKVHTVLTSERSQMLSSVLLIGAGAFSAYTTFVPLFLSVEDQQMRRRTEAVQRQESQKKP